LKKLPDINEWSNAIIGGDIAYLSRGITLVESTLSEHQQLAEQLLELCLPHAGKSIRIGITGVPGVGKSSFIEKFGVYLADTLQKKVAVLAIDPTSSKSKGSILGDKTRMEQLAIHPRAFIRPSAAGESLGGVARKTRESIYLCEAAGYEIILVETVGVGQSETMVHGMVDFFLLLMLSGAGDELQGIKRGIMEMADALIITKADGENKLKAKTAATEYKRALHLLPAHEAGWIPETSICSSLTGEGIDEVWNIIDKYFRHTNLNGYFEAKRKQQAIFWMNETIHNGVMEWFKQLPDLNNKLEEITKQVQEGKITSYAAAKHLLKQLPV
jgi:LAO/AO transport system kinase